MNSIWVKNTGKNKQEIVISMSELLKVDIYDKLTVNGKAVKSGEGKTPTDVPAGSSTTINFESEVNSKGKSKMKFSFKKQTVETKQNPQVLEKYIILIQNTNPGSKWQMLSILLQRGHP